MFTSYFNHYAQTELDIPAAPGIAPDISRLAKGPTAMVRERATHFC